MLFALGGDVMLARGVSARLLEGAEPAWFWGDLAPELARADLRLVNLECAVALTGRPWRPAEKEFHFRAHPRTVRILEAVDIDAVSLANNHVLDYGEPALQETLHHLDHAGIAHAGAGLDRDAAWRPAIVHAGGLRVALLAFTDNEPEFAARADRGGTAFAPISLGVEGLGVVEPALAAARAAADVVVCSIHWGPNFLEQPPQAHRELARALVERGADVVHGHSAHVFQGVEAVRGRPVLYDTGELLDDYAVDRAGRNDWSFLFLVRVEGQSFEVEMVPVTLSFGKVELARGEVRDAILARMEERSAALGTRLRRSEGRLYLACG